MGREHFRKIIPYAVRYTRSKTTQRRLLMRLTTTALLLLAMGGLAACETTKGLGRDVETAGQVIERESRDVQHTYGYRY